MDKDEKMMKDDIFWDKLKRRRRKFDPRRLNSSLANLLVLYNKIKV